MGPECQVTGMKKVSACGKEWVGKGTSVGFGTVRLLTSTRY